MNRIDGERDRPDKHLPGEPDRITAFCDVRGFVLECTDPVGKVQAGIHGIQTGDKDAAEIARLRGMGLPDAV
jgi:hypothetical protein